MPKRNRKTDATSIERRIQQGYGQGSGTDYKPWLVIQDVASQGLVSRIKGHKSQRVHHLFSKHEQNYFYLLDLSSQVRDIREQYPLLPLVETQEIAQKLGFRHPTDPQTRTPIVMTTDFLVTGTSQQYVRTLKMAKELAKKRTLEKLEIERLYWQARNIDWGIVTEHEIPAPLAANARLLHRYYDISERQLSEAKIAEAIQTLTNLVSESRLTLGKLASRCDQQLSLSRGTSLVVIYHLIATHRWQVNLNQPLNISQPLAFEALVSRQSEVVA